jgi:uncharacterized protein (DUF58 family)
MKINFAKLNHILIPTTKADRDRFRHGLLARLLSPLTGLYNAFSEEGRVLALAALVTGGFGLDVHSSDVYVLWAALSALLFASLLATRAHALGRFRLDVSTPKRVTIGDPITFAIVLHNDGDRDRHAVRVEGPFLPWDGRWTSPSPRVGRVPAGGVVRVETHARFLARGEHHLDAFHAAALVPFGLARGPRVASVGVRFLVIPKIANVVHLRMPIGRRHQPGGVALASKTGESMDLLGVRPYRVGDPVRHLHARSWARVGMPVVREYQEEYFSRIGVLVDPAVPDAARLEAILSLSAGVVACLSRGEALIDLLVVGDRVHDLTIGRNLGFLEQALDLLACVERDPSKIDADALMARLTPHLHRLSCVIVIASAWDDGALAERIRGAGAGCATLIVAEKPSASAPRGRDVQTILAGAIERGEALSL